MSIYNPYIAVPFLTWAIAQLAKVIIAAQRRRFDFRYFYASGGMPSAHSAVVCSLAVTAGLRLGLDSAIFGLTVVFAAIVMYDSFGVRRAAGEQAAAINAIVTGLGRNLGAHQPQRLREILGHKPLEVTVGALTGLGLGLLFNANYLTSQVNWLTSLPTHSEALIYMGVSLALVVLSILVTWWLRRRYPGSKAVAGLRYNILIMGLGLGLVGLVLGFAGYEQALYLGWRLWIYLLSVILLIWVIALVAYYWNRLPKRIATEAEHDRIGRWLPRKRGRARKG